MGSRSQTVYIMWTTIKPIELSTVLSPTGATEKTLEVGVGLLGDGPAAQRSLEQSRDLVEGTIREPRQEPVSALDERLAAATLDRGQDVASRLTIAATAGSGTPTGQAAAAASRSASGRPFSSRSVATPGSWGSGRR